MTDVGKRHGRTLNGQTLIDMAKRSATFELTISAQELVYVVEAIEAEAVAAERARIRAGVEAEGSPDAAGNWWLKRDAVLAIIEGADDAN